uniref:Uncharacterized protein n=1 Tax=Branchiostoma floridae TaxID=7739 RepID=C3Z7S2_BRAFL|eukprot:XP_002595415.1 hypothetical protein BRAFLDRAFT_119028 [Branchiostoma floridae]
MPTVGRQGKSGKGQRTGPAKNPREQWIEAMRGRTGALTGCIRNGVDTGRPPSRNAATASSSQYLKSVMTGRTLSSYKEVPLTQKLPSGTPAYKPQEDMYDEIIDLKKTVVQQKTENDTLKSRVGRLEEANKAKSNALKAAVYNSKPDSTTMVNNQKQRILKLEQTIRERDNTISAMKDDMRATRLQELEMQADIYFQEMQRLQAAPQSSKERPPSKESSAKVKALNDTILRLTDANQRLQAENKGLRQDLDKAMDGDRKELLDKIKKLEQDRSAMGSQASLVSSKADDKKDNEDYKKERDKLKSTVHRLKEDRNFYRNQAQEKEKEVEDLNAEVARLREKLIKVKQERLAREREEREAKQQDSAARSIQKNWRGHRAREEGREMRKRLAAERDEEKQQEKERERKRREREEREREEQDMAAAKIQKNWRKHKTSAAELIQSSVRGHFTRQRQLGEEETETESDEASSSDMESATTRVQSSVRGHWARSEQLQDKERSPRRKSLDRDEAAMLIQSSVRGHWGRQGIMGHEVGSKSDMDTTTADDSSDEDDVVVSRPSSRPSSRPPSRPPSRPSSRGSLRSSASGDRLRDPPVPSRSSAGSRTSGSAADVRTASPSNDSDSDSDDVVMPTIRRPTPAPRRIMEVSMPADDPPEPSPIMTVTDMLQAVVTEDDYKRWRKENGIGEKKKKKKKMPRKGLDELKSERSSDSESNERTDGRMSWADIIELEEGDSQSDDSADQETTGSETRRAPSPDRAHLDRRKQTTGPITSTKSTEALTQAKSTEEVSPAKSTKAVTPAKSTEKETPAKSTEAVTPAKSVNGSSQSDTVSQCSRTKNDTTANADKLCERDTVKKIGESDTPSSSDRTTDDVVRKVHIPATAGKLNLRKQLKEETIEKLVSLTSAAENDNSARDESNPEAAKGVTAMEDCQSRKGTRKTGQHRLTADQHRHLQELRRRYPSIPPLTWQRLRAVLENHPAMLDMPHDDTLTFFSQQPPRVMSKAVDNLRKDCYQKMRNPWNFLQALTETAAREYINHSVYNSAV